MCPSFMGLHVITGSSIRRCGDTVWFSFIHWVISSSVNSFFRGDELGVGFVGLDICRFNTETRPSTKKAVPVTLSIEPRYNDNPTIMAVAARPMALGISIAIVNNLSASRYYYRRRFVATVSASF